MKKDRYGIQKDEGNGECPRRCMPEIIELSSIKISQEMKNKGLQNIEKLILKNGKKKNASQ